MDEPPVYKKVPLPPPGQPKWLQLLGKVFPKLAALLTKAWQELATALKGGGKGFAKNAATFTRKFIHAILLILSLPLLGFANFMRWFTRRRYKRRESKAEKAIQRGPVYRTPRKRSPLLDFILLGWLTRPAGRFLSKLWSKWWIRIPATAVIFLFTIGLTFGGILTGIAYFKAQSFNMDKVSDLNSGCVVLDRNGKEMGRVFVKNRDPIKYAQLPKHYIDALIATEDERFFEHKGNDFQGIFRATLANMRSMRVRQGASTITQQLARDVYELRSMDILRKLTEIFVARRIEQRYNKEEILQHYVNRIYMGSGCWGVGAAALRYYGKEVEQLTVPESALLCGIIKRPSDYSPFRNPKAARNTRNYTLQRMAELGFIGKDQAKDYRESDLAILPPDTRDDPPHYLLAEIRRQSQEILESRNLPLEGFRIQTTVDTSLQEYASVAMNEVLKKIEAREGYPHQTYVDYHAQGKTVADDSPAYVQCAAVILHNATGQVIAAVGGRDFTHSQFNRVFQARRPTGSAFLPLVYAAAFEVDGLDPLTPVLDAPIDNRKVMIGGERGVLGEWSTETVGNVYEGEVPAAYALLRSKNGATVRFGSMAGLAEVKSLAKRAGIQSEMRDYPSTLLGSSEVTPLELARAYTLFPNRGWAPREPALVARITKPDGTPIYEQASELRFSVLSELSAVQVSSILQASMQTDPAKTVREENSLPLQYVAAKTGTAYDFTDAWAVGYSTEYTCAVWVGFDSPQTIFDGAYGNELALPIWGKIMNRLKPNTQLPLSGVGESCTICMLTGQRATTKCEDEHGDKLFWSLPFATDISSSLKHCDVHNTALIAQPINSSASGVRTVNSKSAVLVGDDPYQALSTTETPVPVDP